MPVYFIRPVGMSGPVKIGCSNWPQDRLDTLSAWSPYPLEIVAEIADGDMQMERRIHCLFAEQHSHREWFRESPALTSMIDRLRAGESIGDIIDVHQPVGRWRVIKRKPLTDAQRIGIGYRMKLYRARKPFWDGEWQDRRYFPHAIYSALDEMQSGQMPTAEQRAQMDAFIADAKSHVVSWAELESQQKAAA